MKKHAAFTLIELLIALAIFAILSIISYRTLSSVFQTREQLNFESAKWRDLSLFFTRLESDLANTLDREIRTADGRSAAPLCLSTLPPNPAEATLAFTRTGFAEAAGTNQNTSNSANSAPQRIGYRFAGGKIEWMLWPALDQAPRSQPEAYVTLANVRDAKWRALDRSGGASVGASNWRYDWPAPPSNCARVEKGAAIFPAALELTLTMLSGETITRVFALRPAANTSAGSASGG
jgi:general secretion pathway protein J